MFHLRPGLVAVSLVVMVAGGIRAAPAAESPGSQVVSVSEAPQPADEEIRGSLFAKLGRDRHLVANGIFCSVDSGVVQLTGTVPLSLWKDRAERIARAVRGVRAVVNRIRIVPVRRPDREVERDVRAALSVTAALARMPIRASVFEGVAELRGRITSWEEQQLAERVASSIPGVRFCQNQLVAGTRGRSDAILAGDIRTRFDWDPLLEHDPIRVDVRDARVFLSGQVGSRAEASQALSLARVKGVVAVDGAKLQVARPRPDGDVRERWPSDGEISAAMPLVARYWSQVPFSGLNITVLDGTVTLRGTVQNLGESRAAADMARAAVGVARVDNQLRGPWWREPSTSAPPRRRRAR